MKEWILSPIEKTCLRWISRGRTVAEIALLEARSTEEAIEKANLSEPE
ncbi:LuxR family transcriptional regulator [Rhizobium leguminosarum bv. viciae]|nr:LuxR family transcriptional regulator [Rhizobium leguminosarum bv. viciae]